MKSLLQKGVLLVALLISVSSCIDLQESIYMRNDGSGKFAFTVNLEDVESLLQLVTKLSGEEDAGNDFMTEADVSFNDLKEELEKMDGISQVKTIRENENKLLGVAFEFRDVKALNRAIKKISDDKKEPASDYFAYKNGKLSRLNTLGVKDQVQHKIESEIDISIDGVTLSSLLKDMTYTTKYTFEKPIKEASNPASKVTNEGRTVTLTYHFFDEAGKVKSLENNISF